MALAHLAARKRFVTVGAQKFWQLRDSLPTGKVLDLDEARDMRQGRDYETLKLDDVSLTCSPSLTTRTTTSASSV